MKRQTQNYGWELTNIQRVVGDPIKGALSLWELPSTYKMRVL